MILQQKVDDFHQYPPPPFGLVVFKRQLFFQHPLFG